MTTTDEVRIILVRHGRTQLNATGRLRGHLDPQLDEIGLHEVEALAQALASERIRVVVTSPLRRARQTAEAIARAAGVPLTVDDRLIDRDYGVWAGHPASELARRFGAIDAAPGVEAAASVLNRGLRVLEDVKEIHSSPVALVAHDAVNTLLLTALQPGLADDPAFAQDTACWNVLNWNRAERRWLLDEINRTAPPA